MPSGQFWKSDAILRLFLSVVVCYFAGNFLIVALEFTPAPSRPSLRFWLVIGSSLVCLAATLVLLHRKWREETVLLRLAMVMVCLYGGLMLGTWAAKMVTNPVKPSVSQMIVSALSLQGAVLVMLLPFLREHEVSLRDGFGFRNAWPRAVLLGLAIGCIFLPLGLLLQEASAHLMMRLHLKPEQQQVVQTLQMDHASAGRLVFGLISIVLVPPAEEAFFRGILYRWIRDSGFPRLALWGTSLAFAAIHNNLMSFVPLLVLAITLALLYERTNNLLAPISAHALFNTANLIWLYVLEHAMR